MRVQVGVIEQEGFLASVAVRFENGLTLRNTGPAFHWQGTAKQKEAIHKFREVIAQLQALGVEVCGMELLEQHE